MKRRVFCLLLCGFLILPRAGAAVAQDRPAGQSTPFPADSHIHDVMHDVIHDATGANSAVFPRLGITASGGSQSVRSEAVQSLRAGVYVNWGTRASAPRPNGMEYVQMVRLHQELTCPLNSEIAWNRARCPYVEPHTYIVWPSLEEIAGIARAAPGSLWLVGNEIDRRDWYRGGQDEMLPELYARAYHDIYTAIKNADSGARVAIAGMVQPTPLRLEYLTRVWDSYRQQYGNKMPVDVWNVHNFILQEVHHAYGADIPPGLPTDGANAVTYGTDWMHVNREIFDQQIRDFRAWMAARGQQQKPLIISEFGVLYVHCAEWDWTGEAWVCIRNFDDEDLVIEFMIDSFDYFLNEKDCTIGYAADDCRLVQRWFWFSLDYQGGGFNQHARLYDVATDTLTPAGDAFRDWANRNADALSDPLPHLSRRIFLPTVLSTYCCQPD